MNLKTVLNIQDNLNEVITPNWKEVRTLRDLYVAFKQEVSEAIDCFPWKWWKVYDFDDPDYDNLRLELIDIFHFYLSIMILNYKHLSFEDISKQVYLDITETDIQTDGVLFNKVLKLDVIAYYACTTRRDVYFKELTFEFWNTVNYLMDTNTFINLYLFKVALNHLRQELKYDSEYHKKFKESDIDNKVVVKLSKEYKPESVDDAKEILKKTLLGV